MDWKRLKRISKARLRAQREIIPTARREGATWDSVNRMVLDRTLEILRGKENEA